MFPWLRQHKFKTHLTIFAMMLLASIGLYIAMVRGTTNLFWPLIAVFILANLVAMAVK